MRRINNELIVIHALLLRCMVTAVAVLGVYCIFNDVLVMGSHRK